MATTLLYMEDFDVTTCDATVEKVDEHEGKTVLVLDQTCIYPKGGGQDFDTGTITDEGGNTFFVEAAFYVDQEVKHFGSFEANEFEVGAKVTCKVDPDRRALNTRIHSAGHVIDMAVRGLGYNWVPGKGAHYPDMAFVEYEGDYEAEKREETIKAIQDSVNKIIETGTRNHIEFMTPEEMAAGGAHVPENIPKDKPSRVMVYDNFAVPCGGTHVKNAADVGTLTVTKIKNKGGAIRISYSVE